jgi:hypothetical protein
MVIDVDEARKKSSGLDEYLALPGAGPEPDSGAAVGRPVGFGWLMRCLHR